jgi:hypothetical protein
MRSIAFALAVYVLAVTVLVAVAFGPVRAQQHHHPLHKDFYHQWKQPGTGASCCNARIETDGVERGDCEPSRAEVRNGNWWVWIRQINQWLIVPDAKIIREKNPNVFDAHICWTPWTGIICFVPPATGG